MAGSGGRLSRRRFLASAAGVGAATVAGGVAGGLLVRNLDESSATPGERAGAGLVAFEGRHQGGITRPLQTQATAVLAAFDVVAGDRSALERMFREVTARTRELARGFSPPAGDPLYPPPESGVLGASTGPSDLTITAAVGASLFDDRFGLAGQRPRRLATMPAFPNDILNPDMTHGDLLIQICATDQLACVHALRYLMAHTRDSLRLRWMMHGFQRQNVTASAGHTTTRNLMGFKDGTANLDHADDALMDRIVWVQPGDPEPAWTSGGSYQVIRVIRMFVERWDRTALGEQQKIIGRVKRTGAPLGGDREEQAPSYDDDQVGLRIPLDAHIRLANPRAPATEANRILRRGYSYARGFDAAGLLDQGLVFVCFQRDLDAGFVAVQRRLSGEPLDEYIRPIGGGFFFALPGVTGPAGFLGESMLA
jgi:deferrochelatase/peroxidase EfeB